jgi:hypothetical protein
MINLATALFLIAFEMCPEGLRLRQYHKIAASIEFIYRAVVTLVLFSWITWNTPAWFEYNPDNFWMIISGYILLRFALADVVHNISAKLPLFYIGNTKWYDIIWQKFFKWTKFPPEHFLAMIKFICLLIGVTWLIRY